MRIPHDPLEISSKTSVKDNLEMANKFRKTLGQSVKEVSTARGEVQINAHLKAGWVIYGAPAYDQQNYEFDCLMVKLEAQDDDGGD